MAQGTWRPIDVTLLERFCASEQRAREARARLEESGWTARGSQGQLVQHPDAKTLREAELDAHRYATDLILTPESRRRHSIEVAPPGGGKLEAILGGKAAAG